MAREVKVVIEPDGTVTIEAIGYKGPMCEAAVREVEEYLGGQTIDKQRKPEYYQVHKQHVSQH